MAVERFVPKVHPASRGVEPEDPMVLCATPVAGDPELMLRCVVQEYAGLGWEADAILALFREPFYPALNALLAHYGEAGVRERILDALRQCGVLRVRESTCAEPEPEPELVELGVPAGWHQTTSEWSAARSRGLE